MHLMEWVQGVTCIMFSESQYKLYKLSPKLIGKSESVGLLPHGVSIW